MCLKNKRMSLASCLKKQLSYDWISDGHSLMFVCVSRLYRTKCVSFRLVSALKKLLATCCSSNCSSGASRRNQAEEGEVLEEAAQCCRRSGNCLHPRVRAELRLQLQVYSNPSDSLCKTNYHRELMGGGKTFQMSAVCAYFHLKIPFKLNKWTYVSFIDLLVLVWMGVIVLDQSLLIMLGEILVTV